MRTYRYAASGTWPCERSPHRLLQRNSVRFGLAAKLKFAQLINAGQHLFSSDNETVDLLPLQRCAMERNNQLAGYIRIALVNKRACFSAHHRGVIVHKQILAFE